MKNFLTTQLVVGAVLAALHGVPLSAGQAAGNVTDALEVVRSTYATDRQAFVAESMQLTETEGAAFWPLYRQYRAAREALGDDLVKLVLEYADAYPNVPEDRAKQLLKDYSALEKKLATQRASYLKKFAGILPASKALRFAQLENRLDLVLRLQLASRVPLVPTEGRLAGVSAGGAAIAEGVPGGIIVQTHELVATVIAVQKASRKVTLLSPEGIKQTVQVGPEAINFDQIRVGDRLKVEVTEELVVQLAGPGESPDDAAAAVVALAPKGAKPGGVMAETTQVTATLQAIDEQQRTATLRFEDGSTKTFPVRRDVDLGKRKVGEKVVFSATEMVAIRVEKP